MLYEFDGQTPEIGRGTYVSETAVVIGSVKIGPGCYIGHGAILRGDYGAIEIGPETAVEEGVVMHAAPGKVCRVGRRVTFGHGAVVHSEEISDFAVVGMGAVVSLGVRIGEWAIVAEGAVVKMNQSIPAGAVAAGSPASVVRSVEDRDRNTWSEAKQLYADLAGKYLKLGMRRLD